MLRIKFNNLVLLLVLFTALALVAVACGGDDPTAAPAATTAPAAAPTTAPAAAPTTAPAAAAPTTAPSGPEPTPTRATGAFRATPTPAAAAAPTAVPTEAPAMMEAMAKVETLVISVDPSAGETNLPWAGTVDHHQQMDLVMEVLVDIDPTTNVWVPELAKSWELSPDGTEWTFQLEEGIQFHNGWGEFTAKDVFHSVSMNQREDAILAYATDWRQIDLDASTMVSDYEVILKLKNPNPDYLFYIAPSGGGLIMSKAHYDSGGDAAYEEDMIGTGPYRYTGREFGVNVTFERIEGDHWRRGTKDGLAPPSFEKVDLRWIREVASRNAGLIAEEIHLTELTRDLADAAVSNHGMKIIQSNFPGNQLNGIFQGLHPLRWAISTHPSRICRSHTPTSKSARRSTAPLTGRPSRTLCSAVASPPAHRLGSIPTSQDGIRAGWMNSTSTTVMTRRGPGSCWSRPATRMVSRSAVS